MLKEKQIDSFSDAFVKVSNFTANGTSDAITTQLTSVLTTAGKGSVSVPVQVAANEGTVGVVVNTTLPIWSNTTKKPLVDSNNNEIYGKLSESAGVYTLSYFSFSGGSETAYNFASDTAIDFLFPYRFDLYRRPVSFAIAYPIGDINLPPVGSTTQPNWFPELIIPTALNTVPNLTKTPTSNTDVMCFVNGLQEYSGSSFTVSGKTITWVSATAGYSVTTTDKLYFFYKTAE